MFPQYFNTKLKDNKSFNINKASFIALRSIGKGYLLHEKFLLTKSFSTHPSATLVLLQRQIRFSRFQSLLMYHFLILRLHHFHFDFCQKKNSVNNFNKNLTPSSAHKSYINTNQSVSDSDIQSDNNFATSADIFNRGNANELAQSPDICINDNIVTPSPTL